MCVRKDLKCTHISEVDDYLNQAKKIPFSLICSDLSLTLKKAPFSENSRTPMLTHIVKVVTPGLKPKEVGI